MKIALEAIELKKIYKVGKVKVPALNGVDLVVDEGEFVSLMGPSGCGKSTLLHLLGGLVRPTSGKIHIDGQELSRLSSRRLTKLRRERIGFVFQMLNLLPTLSALGNLQIAHQISKKNENGTYHPKELIKLVGLDGKMHRKPRELSYGEQQRVAIARALVNKPSILLADEPTGSLDSENSRKVLEIFRELNSNLGQTILMITHDQDVAGTASRIVRMRDGRIVT